MTMTRDDILRMEAGPELDALVAEKVMGWKVKWHDGYWTMAIPKAECVSYGWNWRPSEDIAAADEVAEKIGIVAGKSEERQPGQYFAVVSSLDDSVEYWWDKRYGHYYAYTPTKPLAICRAALLAVMEGELE